MMTRRQASLALLSSATLAAPRRAGAALSAIALPAPRRGFGKSLAEALQARRSIREFTTAALPDQLVSDLLWGAFGINRPQSGDRTAPSWRHSIELELHVATAQGVWRYEPHGHRLVPELARDIRADTGTQDFVGQAPLNLVYVADGARMGAGTPAADQHLYAYADSGFVGQNVYLFCASEGLATVFRGSLDRAKLASLLGLPETKFVTFAQSVGYPKG